MTTLKTWDQTLSDKQLSQICKQLEDGALIIWPTDTIYAIACHALNSKAIDKLCSIKGINPDKTNLSIVCDSISMASQYAKWDNWCFQLLKKNTPGPFTFLFKTASTLPREFKRRKIVGIRIPELTLCRQIVNHLGAPLLTTSIEGPDEDYITNPDLIKDTYKNKIDIIIDAGPGATTPSAIIDCCAHSPEIIREGIKDLS